jgi:hypothetical protein
MPRPWKLHKFWSCPRASKAWEWTITLSCIVSMCCRTPSLCVEKCLFNGKLDTSLRKFGAYGPYSGVSFYLDWEVFFSSTWHDAKLGKIMWDGLLDYGKLEWMKNSLPKVKQQLTKRLSCSKNLTGFALWMVVCVFVDLECTPGSSSSVYFNVPLCNGFASLFQIK